MKLTARIAVTAYALAIVLASIAPHCAWMFASTVAASAPMASHSEHTMAHSDGDQHAPDGECASMAMAKSVGPLPATIALIAPDNVSVLAIMPTPAKVLVVQLTQAPRPRGPPRTSSGFASIFASNHRLLI